MYYLLFANKVAVYKQKLEIFFTCVHKCYRGNFINYLTFFTKAQAELRALIEFKALEKLSRSKV